MICVLSQHGFLPAGFFEEQEAVQLSIDANVPLQLARLIIDAEIENDDFSDEVRRQRRIEIAMYFMRVLRLFMTSRMRNNNDN